MAKKVPKMAASDTAYAIKELEAWRDGLRGSKLTWSLLAKSTGFSRQTLFAKPEIYAAYAAAKKSLASGQSPRKARGDDYQSEQIANLELEIERFKALEAGWLERWSRIAFHARGKGLSIEDLDKPLPPVDRR